MPDLWVISTGEYSDYRVLAAFANKELAEDAARMRAPDGWRDEYRVETLPYFEDKPKLVTLHLHNVEVWDDGTTSDPVIRERTEVEFDMLYGHYKRPVGWRWVRAPIHQGKGGRLEVYGTSRQRVAKVFSDTRARLLADDAFRMQREAHS